MGKKKTSFDLEWEFNLEVRCQEMPRFRVTAFLGDGEETLTVWSITESSISLIPGQSWLTAPEDLPTTMT